MSYVDFDFTTWPLEDRTEFTDVGVYDRRVMDDGSPRSRRIGTSDYQQATLRWANLTEDDADDLRRYILAGMGTQFRFAGGGWGADAYYGRIWSNPRVRVQHGILYSVRVDIYARRGGDS